MMEPNDKPEKKPTTPKKTNTPKKRRGRPRKRKEKDAEALQGLASFFARSEDPSVRKHKQDLKNLHSTVSEYLGSYIIIGYTVDGKPVAKTYAGSQRDMDALSTGLQKFIVDSISPHNFPPGNME